MLQDHLYSHFEDAMLFCTWLYMYMEFWCNYIKYLELLVEISIELFDTIESRENNS